jgi:hypothetical protein
MPLAKLGEVIKKDHIASPKISLLGLFSVDVGASCTAPWTSATAWAIRHSGLSSGGPQQ